MRVNAAIQFNQAAPDRSWQMIQIFLDSVFLPTPESSGGNLVMYGLLSNHLQICNHSNIFVR
jgi:hypothetical protein